MGPCCSADGRPLAGQVQGRQRRRFNGSAGRLCLSLPPVLILSLQTISAFTPHRTSAVVCREPPSGPLNLLAAHPFTSNIFT